MSGIQMPRRWLIKSEPSAWSWDDQVKKGVEAWTGVRNYQASNNLKAMRLGDTCFFYHSVEQRRIVGVVEVVREAFPDPTEPTSRWVAVDVKTVKPVERPVTLADIKAEPRLSDIALIRQSRLSVVPLTEEQWQVIMSLTIPK
jgi:predicted RNA-binding protein with PUA-like domain